MTIKSELIDLLEDMPTDRDTLQAWYTKAKELLGRIKDHTEMVGAFILTEKTTEVIVGAQCTQCERFAALDVETGLCAQCLAQRSVALDTVDSRAEARRTVPRCSECSNKIREKAEIVAGKCFFCTLQDRFNGDSPPEVKQIGLSHPSRFVISDGERSCKIKFMHGFLDIAFNKYTIRFDTGVDRNEISTGQLIDFLRNRSR